MCKASWHRKRKLHDELLRHFPALPDLQQAWLLLLFCGSFRPEQMPSSAAAMMRQCSAARHAAVKASGRTGRCSCCCALADSVCVRLSLPPRPEVPEHVVQIVHGCRRGHCHLRRRLGQRYEAPKAWSQARREFGHRLREWHPLRGWQRLATKNALGLPFALCRVSEFLTL